MPALAPNGPSRAPGTAAAGAYSASFSRASAHFESSIRWSPQQNGDPELRKTRQPVPNIEDAKRIRKLKKRARMLTQNKFCRGQEDSEFQCGIEKSGLRSEHWDKQVGTYSRRSIRFS